MTGPHDAARRFVEDHDARTRLLCVDDAFAAAARWPERDRADFLRRVAVELEEAFHAEEADPEAHWRVMATLYDHAATADAHDPEPLISKSLSALWMSETLQPGDLQETLRATAVQAAREAIGRTPRAARAHHSLGLSLYAGTDDDLHEALWAFQRASELDPTDPWSLLYTAHVLQDLERWDEAARAYAAVPTERFDPPRRWRGLEADELRAWCLRHAGDGDAALAQYHRVLDAFEARLEAVEATSGPERRSLMFVDDHEPDCLFDEATWTRLPEIGGRAAALAARVAALDGAHETTPLSATQTPDVTTSHAAAARRSARSSHLCPQ